MIQSKDSMTTLDKDSIPKLVEAAIERMANESAINNWDKTTGDRGARMYRTAFIAGIDVGRGIGRLEEQIAFWEAQFSDNPNDSAFKTIVGILENSIFALLSDGGSEAGEK